MQTVFEVENLKPLASAHSFSLLQQLYTLTYVMGFFYMVDVNIFLLVN